jgi:hypothetical protein
MRNFDLKMFVPMLFLAVLLVAGFSTNVTAGIPNIPPICDANGPYLAECSGEFTEVTLDGSGSSDPDGEIVSWEWDLDGDGDFDDATGETLMSTFPLGESFVGLLVSDGFGGQANCSENVEIRDTTPPEVNCTGTTVPAESPDGAVVDVLGLFNASDTCGEADSSCDPDSGLFPIGATDVQCTAVDDSGNAITCPLTVQVIPDECSDAYGPLAVDSVTPGTTIGATFDAGPNFCDTRVTAPGVWYTVVGTGNTMTASTCNDGNADTGSADYDTKISIFCADCDNRTCVAGQDDNFGAGCDGFSTKLSWPSQADNTYLILVHGFGNATGNFELAILDDGVPVSDYVSCNPEIDIKPGSFPNSINTSKCKGKIPVAILGNEFDVTTVDVETLEFGPSGAYPAHDLTKPATYDDHLQDVDYDLDTDFVSHYQCQETGIADGDTEACLSFSILGLDFGSNCFDITHGPGCEDPTCEATVCGLDPFCCNVNWDGLCVGEAIEYCGVARSFESCDSVRTVPSQ